MIFQDVPNKALAIYAHPDDPETSAGGTLARWAEQGTDVCIVVAAQGDKPERNTGSKNVSETRAKETRKASDILGAKETLFLGIPDGEVENTLSFREQLVTLIREFEPTAILTPDPTSVFFGDTYINHPDHRELGWAVLDSVGAASNESYFPKSKAQNWTTSFLLLSGTMEPNCWVDIEQSLTKKVEAVACHESQIEGDWPAEFFSTRAREIGGEVGLVAAESFRKIDFVRN